MAIWALKVLLAALLIGWLLRSGRLDLRPFAALRPDLALLAVILGQAAMLVLPLLRWHLLIRGAGFAVKLGWTLHVGVIGLFSSLFIPGFLGIDGVRSYYLMRIAPERRAEALGSVFIDRLIGLLVLLAIGPLASLALLAGEPAAPWLGRYAAFTITLFAGVLGGLGLLFTGRLDPLLRRLGRERFVGRLVAALRAYRGRPRILVQAIALSLAGHLAHLTAACWALAALGYRVPVVAVLIVDPILSLARQIPLTPLGIGLTEGLADELYRLTAMEGGAELVLLLRLVTATLTALCGLALLARVRAEAVQ